MTNTHNIPFTCAEEPCLTPQNRTEAPQVYKDTPQPQTSLQSRKTHVLNTERLWSKHADLLASVPEEDKTFVKLGILEEYILTGIRNGTNKDTLLLLATLGVAIANNDKAFYDQVCTLLSSLP